MTRPSISGLTQHSSKGHIARAVLEATAWQTREVLDAMRADAGAAVAELRVDGGMVHDDLLMQIQADVLGTPVVRPVVTETTALVAAYAAGLAVGFWAPLEELREHWVEDRRRRPQRDARWRDAEYETWKRAVERTFDWVRPAERVPE